MQNSYKVFGATTDEKLAKALGYTFDPKAECGNGSWFGPDGFLNLPSFTQGTAIRGLPEFTNSVDVVLYEIKSLDLRYSVADCSGDGGSVLACVYPRGGSHRNNYTASAETPAMALALALSEYVRFMKKTKQQLKRIL